MGTPEQDILSSWQSYLTNISSNLMELSDQTEYKIIKAGAADLKNGYTGITKELAQRCVDSVGTLWRYFALLSEVVDKAASLYSKKSFLYNSGEDIRELFEKTSVVIDSKHVDVKDRNILDDEKDEKKATPKELLQLMQQTFENTGQDIKKIVNAQNELDIRLANIKKEIEGLGSFAAKFNISSIPEFDTQKINKLVSDPLTGMIELDKLVYNIEKYRASIRDIEEEYNNTQKKLETISAILSELSALAARSRNALTESRRIFGIQKDERPVIEEQIVESLKDWHKTLQNKFKEGAVKAVKIGAAKLEREALDKLQRETENYNYNSRLYNEWLDLKGQFSALTAKADVLKTRGQLFSSSVNDLIIQTAAVMNAFPVNFEYCKELVKKISLSL